MAGEEEEEEEEGGGTFSASFGKRRRKWPRSLRRALTFGRWQFANAEEE